MTRVAREQTRAEEMVERQIHALEMRKAGASYREIADALGISTQSVGVLVRGALALIENEHAADVRKLERERLDVALRGIWPRVKEGNPRAVTSLIQIQERRAKLEGLDIARGEVSLHVTTGTPSVDLTRLSVPELRAHWQLMARAATSEEERERFEASAEALVETHDD